MDCKNCLVLELTYEIRFEGNHNVSMMQDIVKHLLRRNIGVNIQNKRLKIKESSVRELLDFCTGSYANGGNLLSYRKQRVESIERD